jgi:hypothetical protein
MPSQKYNNATELTQLIEGIKVTDLTKLSKGLPNLDIQGVENFSFRLNHINLLQIVSFLSKVDAKVYILDAKIRF